MGWVHTCRAILAVDNTNTSSGQYEHETNQQTGRRGGKEPIGRFV